MTDTVTVEINVRLNGRETVTVVELRFVHLVQFTVTVSEDEGVLLVVELTEVESLDTVTLPLRDRMLMDDEVDSVGVAEIEVELPVTLNRAVLLGV